MIAIKIGLLSLLSMSFLLSCSSTTIIKATSSGAKFYADGHYLGEDLVSYTDKKIVGSSTVIEIKKEGFKDKIASISRSGQLNPAALVGGILLSPTVVGLLFFLWVVDYNPYYVFELEANK